MPLDDPKIYRRNYTWFVVGVLFVSLILRCILILRGGQYYISDETRYEVSRDAARLLWQGQMGEALRQFTIAPEHLGFKVVGIIPALIEHITGPSLAMPAMFFSLFSILDLYLIFLISRRTSVFPNGPLFTLTFGALSHSLLYYSRHLFPYDMSLAFGLLALYIALGQNHMVKRSFGCGALSFLCFITYNGYWPLAAFTILVSVLFHAATFAEILQKAILSALGFILPLALVLIAMLWAGTDMISAYRLFATSITQGSFEEGWSLPFAYLWYTEHILIFILGALSFYGLMNAKPGKRNHVVLWAAGFLFIYLCLLIPSVFLHYFVVYGRLARQMIPFLVLLSAEGIAHLEYRARPRWTLVALILAAVLIQATWNFAESYRLAYPRDFVAKVQARFPKFEFSTKRLAFGAPVICQNNGYILENTKYYVDPPEESPDVPGQLLLSARHPSSFRPYQYDGDSPATRAAFDALQLRMNFYQVDEEFMSGSNRDWSVIMNCWLRDE